MKVVELWGVALVTKYLPPTNSRGSRIRVRRSDHRSGDKVLTVSWDYELDTQANHAEAIRQYAELMGDSFVTCDWVVGHNSDGYVGLQVRGELS